MKSCTKCNKEKSLDEFYKLSKSKDGLYPHCKACHNDAVRKWQTFNPDKVKSIQKKHRDSHKERRNAQSRDWYQRNRDKAIQTTALFIINHRDKYRSLQTMYRSIRALVKCQAFVDRTVVWDRDGGICYLCGEEADRNDWHLDHIVPLAGGGENVYENVAVTHPSCNRKKYSNLIKAI